MSVIKKRESYRWTVEHVAAMRNGEPELFTFDAEFKALTKTAVDQVLAKAAARKLSDEEFLGGIVAGWHDMKREDGSPWEYSPEAVRELEDLYSGVGASICRAWVASVKGGNGSR
jgi:hypothetical protein